MKGKINFLALLIGFQLFSLEAGIVIENITLIDAKNGTRTNQTVSIENGVIQSIGSAKLDMEDSQIIDGEGKYLIPGLWDAHVHLTFIPEIDHETHFKLYLKNGVTSIRDTGAILSKLQPSLNFIEENPNTTPRLFYAGPLIDGADRVYKGMEPGFPNLSIGIDETSNIPEVVDGLVKEGATFLKSYEMLTRETYLELLKVAGQNGLRVTGHVPLSIDLEEAIEAGLGGMQHVRNMDLACAKDADNLLDDRQVSLENEASIAGSALRTHIHSSQRYYAIDNTDDVRCLRIIKKLSEYGVFQTPTLTINTFDSRRFYADPKWRETYQELPEAAENNWMQGSLKLANIDVTENAKKFDAWSLSLVNKMHQEGVKIIAGTDTPIGYLTPGYSLHKELELLSEAGLSNMDVLRSATITPAEFFGMESQMGTIEVGKLADLVILDKNPLMSISNTQSIHRVIVKGQIQ
ncbi:amidohydrolase family protein [Gammaproteobacteria bacterium]|nr:amidohydrolase family protein [Gammaproteobacteria bacterium]